MTNEIKGGLWILSASILWGFSGVVAKYVFNFSQGIDPFLLVQVRLTLAFLIAFLFFYIKDRNLLLIKRVDLKYFIILGMAGMSTVQFTYLYAIKETNVGVATFLQSFGTILICLYSIFFYKETLGWHKVLSLITGFVGVFIIIFGDSGQSLHLNGKGIAAGLASAVAATFYILYSKIGISKYNPWTILIYAFGFGAIPWLLIVPPWTIFTRGYNYITIGYLVYIAIFSTILPFGFYFKGLVYLKASTASILTIAEPLSASIFAFLLLGETLTPTQILGCLMIASAVIAIQLNLRINRNTIQSLEHLDHQEYIG